MRAIIILAGLSLFAGISRAQLVLAVPSQSADTVILNKTKDCYFDSILTLPTKEKTYVRRHPAHDAGIEYTIEHPAQIKVIGRKGDFYAVNFKREIRYISWEYISETRKNFEERPCSVMSKKQIGDPLLGDTQYTATLRTPVYLLEKPDIQSKNLALITGTGEATITEKVGIFWAVKINGVDGYLTDSGIDYKKAHPVPPINFALLPPGLENSDNIKLANAKIFFDYDKVRKETDKELIRIEKAYQRAVSQTYYLGPRGGCYYIAGSGRKQYVDRSFCK